MQKILYFLNIDGVAVNASTTVAAAAITGVNLKTSSTTNTTILICFFSRNFFSLSLSLCFDLSLSVFGLCQTNVKLFFRISRWYERISCWMLSSLFFFFKWISFRFITSWNFSTLPTSSHDSTAIDIRLSTFGIDGQKHCTLLRGESRDTIK